MIRFGRIFDLATASERRKLEAVERIFRIQFCDVADQADQFAAKLDKRSRLGHDIVLLTAEGSNDEVIGFAFAHYYPALRVAYLDYMASDPERPRRGIGDALYEALREHLAQKGARGLYMEVPQDDPKVVLDAKLLRLNRRRLEFYERYGARPIIGTLYEEPTDVTGNPFLVFDGLGDTRRLARADARRAVKAILVHKYGWDPREERTTRMVRSFRDDPVKLRPPRDPAPAPRAKPSGDHIHALKYVVAPQHELHHVKERGYVERPARVSAIRRALAELPFEERPIQEHGDKPIRAVHDGDFFNYLKAACAKLGPSETLYPYVFPIRRPERQPKDRAVRAGYYCIDTFTPLSREAYAAARDSVDCALSAAALLQRGERLAYALCRPPGHHAERRVFGGFCYFNNAAIAAHQLSASGRVALLDIDFHHGNGAQDIFYRRSDVLTLSIHGHPNHAYPYFSGFDDERGEGDGKGFNRNFALREGVGDDEYVEVLGEATAAIRKFRPTWLVVPLGFDTVKGDPTGSFVLTPRGLGRIGDAIARLELPTLVVQEGGYTLRNLRAGASAFFTGLASAWYR